MKVIKCIVCLIFLINDADGLQPEYVSNVYFFVKPGGIFEFVLNRDVKHSCDVKWT